MKLEIVPLMAFCLAVISGSRFKDGKIIGSTKRNWFHPFPNWEPIPATGDVGEPLILTPLIQQGKIDEARQLSKVTNLTDDPGIEAIQGYSGYFTVNETYNSNLFFWFFPATYKPEESPVLLWLQGGPGSSSLFGLLMENGPFFVTHDSKTLYLNPYSWAANHSVIFMDQPVGTGFSFTDSDEGYATDEVQVGNDVYTALVQFFTMFPEYQNNQFYVAGESYGGKYVPAVGHTIYKKNPTAELKINLQGLSIGNGLTDPESMVSEYSSLMYEYGLISDVDRNLIQTFEESCVQAIKEENWMEAFQNWDVILGEFLTSSGYSFVYNIYYVNDYTNQTSIPIFVQTDRSRKALHVGNMAFSGVGTVYKKLEQDIMKSVKPWVEELLDAGLRIMFYNGNFDIIVGYPLSKAMFDKLQFSGADEYKSAKRMQWKIGNDLAGYYRKGGSFMEVMVRDSGHMVPIDQPAWSLDLITRFTRNMTLQS